jgi:hypothetical protein
MPGMPRAIQTDAFRRKNLFARVPSNAPSAAAGRYGSQHRCGCTGVHFFSKTEPSVRRLPFQRGAVACYVSIGYHPQSAGISSRLLASPKCLCRPMTAGLHQPLWPTFEYGRVADRPQRRLRAVRVTFDYLLQPGKCTAWGGYSTSSDICVGFSVRFKSAPFSLAKFTTLGRTR